MMSNMRRAAVLAGALFVGGAAAAQAQNMDHANMGKMDHADMQKMMMTWPKASQEAVDYMTKKYGPPMEMTASMAMWGKTGPWKRTMVYNYEVQHNFPMPHTDVMQQWIDYRMDPEDVDNITEYDGSVVVERTNGEMSARCDKEGANFLAINLANEVATKKMDSEGARKKYGEEIMKMKAGNMTPYTSGLMFTPMMTGTKDADKPLMMMK